MVIEAREELDEEDEESEDEDTQDEESGDEEDISSKSDADSEADSETDTSLLICSICDLYRDSNDGVEPSTDELCGICRDIKKGFVEEAWNFQRKLASSQRRSMQLRSAHRLCQLEYG